MKPTQDGSVTIGDEQEAQRGGETGHTPGPWNVESDRQPNAITIRFDDGVNASYVATLYPACLCEEHGNHYANARLIAACPTMYDYIKVRAQNGDNDAQKIIGTID